MKSQDPDQQRNLLLAVVLSMAVLLGWQLFYAGPKMKEEQARQRAQQELSQTAGTRPRMRAKPATAHRAAQPCPAPAPPAASVSRDDAIKASPRLAIDTPTLKGSIALNGGRIDDLVLAKYHETVDPKSPNVVLFSPSGARIPTSPSTAGSPPSGSDRQGAGPRHGLADAGSRPADARGAGDADLGQRPGPRSSGAPISVDDDYMFTITDEVENKSAGEISLTPYALIQRHGMPKIESY